MMPLLVFICLLSGMPAPDALDTLISGLLDRLAVEHVFTGSTDKPAVALFISADGPLSADSRHLLTAAVSSRVQRDGRVTVATPAGLTGSSSAESVRVALREAHLAAALDLRFSPRGSRVYLSCRLIASEPADDTIFSIDTELTPDLAAVLQGGESEAPGARDGSRLIATFPAPSNCLGIGCFDGDGDGADELALITPNQVHLYRWEAEQMRLLATIPLNKIAAASQVTRAPAVHTCVIMRESSTEQLLFSGTPWKSGFTVSLAGGGSVAGLPLQPVAARGDTWFGAEFLPGEYVYSGIVQELTLGEDLIPQRLALPAFWRIVPLDTTGGCALVTQDGAAWHWNGGAETSPLTRLPAGIPAAVCSAPRQWPGLLCVAWPRAGGGSDIRLLRLSGTNWRIAGSFLASLDIREMAIYNPRGFSSGLVAAVGTDERGMATLAVFALPATMSWSER